MIKLKRRIGSAFLACMMLLSLLPVAAMAAGEVQTTTEKIMISDASNGNGITASKIETGENWVDNSDALSTANGETTFVDTPNLLYESFGTGFNSSESWEGDVVISTTFYLDPANYQVGEGFVAITDILPSWRAYVASVKKTDDTTIQVSFSNNVESFGPKR